MPAVSPCRKACKWLSWSIGVGTFIFECAAVAWACVHYWRAFVIYFALSVAFVLVPAIVTTVKSLLWLQSYDIQRIRRQGTCLKRLNAVSIFLHLLSMGFVYRYVYICLLCDYELGLCANMISVAYTACYLGLWI